MQRVRDLLAPYRWIVSIAILLGVVVLALVILTTAVTLMVGEATRDDTPRVPDAAPVDTEVVVDALAPTEPVIPPVPVAPAVQENLTTVATAAVDAVDVFAAAGGAPVPERVLLAADQLSGALVFVVRGQQDDWLDVWLPARPNGSTGWIRASDVTLSSHAYTVEVRLGAHRMIVRDGTTVVLDTEVGVGTRDAPTPGGMYYLKELVAPPDPDGAYGPYAYGLSGFSDVFSDYAGGPGVIGIHGTNEPDTVGEDVSDGCLRVTDEIITRMVEDVGLPLGTPVSIVP